MVLKGAQDALRRYQNVRLAIAAYHNLNEHDLIIRFLKRLEYRTKVYVTMNRCYIYAEKKQT